MKRLLWAWRHRGLRARIVLLMGVGAVAPLLVLAGALWTSFQNSREQLFSEQTLLVESIAAHLNYVLESNLAVLQGVSSKLGGDIEHVDPAEAQAAVKEAFLRAGFLDRIFLLRMNGEMISEEPLNSRPHASSLLSLPFVKEALRTGRPTVSELVADSSGPGRLYALSPVRNWQGQVLGLVAAEIDPASARFSSLLQPFAFLKGGSIDLIDSRAAIIASTDPNRLYMRSDHGQFLEGLIRDKKSATGACHSCHQSGTPGGQVKEVLSFAPLSLSPWGVIVRQSEAEAFSSTFSLTRKLSWLAPPLLAVALLFAWGVARSVTRPLGSLTEASERIAAGELDKPISWFGEDEVSRLGRSLEKMRIALQQSLEGVARANRELEQRVKERTREMERLYRQLQEREESGRQLLRKIISAQEEERKRIARGLHDETSQALTAMAVGLDTVLATLPPGESRNRLREASALAVRTIGELHRLILDLRPSVLDDLGLVSAIRWCAERHLQPLGIAVRCEFSGLDQRLPARIEIVLFRAVQEAITNIARHAQAETVLIQCALENGMLTLEIEDDGKGFDPSCVQGSAGGAGGFGLLGIRERMDLLGGTIRLESSPGEGCRILLTISMASESNHA